MQLYKRCTALFLTMLICSINIFAYAHEVPDLSKTGYITVMMTYEKDAVPGGTLTLYKVGDVWEDDGNYSFVLTDDFKDSCVSLENIQSPQLAKTLAVYAEEQELTGTTKEIGNDGNVTFLKMELGLYLLIQTDAAEGYAKVDPFLVSVPMNEDGVYCYEVDASPKVELKNEETSETPSETLEDPKTPTDPKTPASPTTSTTPSSSSLPQTGQLNWPIPVLAVLGLMLFSVGWILRFDRKRDSYEI